MDVIVTILSFLALISLIVGIHELGHFSVARYYNIHVIKFKIGFGKELYSFQDKNNCKYSLGILPLGGYVQMLGENVITEENDNSELKNKKSYLDAALYQRAAVTIAGPLANFLTAILIFFLISIIGTSQLGPYVGGVKQDSLASSANIQFMDKIVSIDEIEVKTFNDINLTLSNRIGDTGDIKIGFIKKGSNYNSYSTVSIENWLADSDQSNLAKSFGIEPLVPPVIGGLLENGPAYHAGLQAGDLIQSINGKPINSWSELSESINKASNENISISVLRENETFLFTLRAENVDLDGVNRGRIGIYASNDFNQWPKEILFKKKENLFHAFLSGFTETYKITKLILVSIIKMINGSVSAENIGGPIMIAEISGTAAKAGLLAFLSMIAILSINLGLINLFPIPVLDGGQLLLIAIEKVRGSPVPEIFLEYSLRIGIFLVASLMIFAFFNDIVRLI